MTLDEWWVDHLESEDAVWTRDEIALITKHSATDAEIIFNLHKLKHAAKELDDVPELMAQIDFSKLHSRVMKSLSDAGHKIEGPSQVEKFSLHNRDRSKLENR